MTIVEKRGRKFAALIMAAVLMALLTGLAWFASSSGNVIPGVGTAIGILAGVFPAYMGANAVVHRKDNQ